MISIVVLHRGWVVIGRNKGVQDGFLRLEDASVIRRWGTSKGLGELASDGKQSATVLDPCGTMTPPVSAIINIIECDKKKWDKVL